ncbi:hypothetical protein C0966_12365 [Bacillus methanolicus]|uniref:hypothetical protein n=1 Tax=Bacillus methanolicus TaxID=1471 RepID=UPI002380B633|nr:hypothetical protein [Bacillus methanolicus]MDE3840141.1 hypothetical protein [Bacillus methanolicus]
MSSGYISYKFIQDGRLKLEAGVENEEVYYSKILTYDDVKDKTDEEINELSVDLRIEIETAILEHRGGSLFLGGMKFSESLEKALLHLQSLEN